MKRTILIVILMLMAVCLMASTKTSSEVLNNILIALSPILLAGATVLGQKLMKVLGINVEDSILTKVFAEILALIVEYEGKNMESEKKFNNVVDKTYALLSKKQKALVEKRYGSIENAVQVMFDQSYVSKKPTKK